MLTRVVAPLAAVLLGYVGGRVAGLEGLEDSTPYGYGVAVLLAVGLYGSTYSIDLTSARRNLRLIVLAVTVGVFVKAALIGGALWWITSDPRFLFLGVVVAQIDPLSVAALMGHPRLSQRAKAILASWSSFDDPMTVILALYAAAVTASLIGAEGGGVGGFRQGGVSGYAVDLAFNLAFALAAYLIWKLVRNRPDVLRWSALVVLFVVAVWGFFMLGLALAGLFFRPNLERLVPRAVNIALALSLVVLGMLLVQGFSVVYGLMLGVAAFGAQVLVGWLLTARLNRQDKLHLAFAQQNGITAIILALLLEPQFPGTVAIVAPAILTVNVLHLVLNKAVDWRLENSP